MRKEIVKYWHKSIKVTSDLGESLKFVLLVKLAHLRLIKHIFLLGVLSVLTSCVQTSSLELPGSVSRLVVVSEINPNQEVSLSLTSTIDLNGDDSIDFPKDGTVLFSGSELGNSSLALTFNEEQNKYIVRNRGFRPQVGSSYKIEVELPGQEFEVVSAFTTIPDSVKIEQTEVKLVKTTQTSDGLTHSTFDITFNVESNNNESSYLHLIPRYEVFDIGMDSENVVFTVGSGEFKNFHIDKILLGKNAAQILSHKSGLIIDNSKLSEGTVKIRVTTITPLLELEAIEEIALETINASEEYYKYNAQISRQLDVENSSFSSPVTTYTNVDGGFGVFAGFSRAEQILQID